LTDIADEDEWEQRAYEFLRAVLNEKAMTLLQATVIIQVGGWDDDFCGFVVVVVVVVMMIIIMMLTTTTMIMMAVKNNSICAFFRRRLLLPHFPRFPIHLFQEFHDPSIKVRAAVTMFRRIVDWHGYACFPLTPNPGTSTHASPLPTLITFHFDNHLLTPHHPQLRTHRLEEAKHV
jgi:hypothetical protein